MRRNKHLYKKESCKFNIDNVMQEHVQVNLQLFL